MPRHVAVPSAVVIASFEAVFTCCPKTDMSATSMSLKPANRICSLLPSATEIVGRLGLSDRLVCVTHECDVAPNEKTLESLIKSGQVARVTSSAINPEVFTQTRIDDMVTASLGTGEGLYGIDNSAVAKARPELIITQQLCTVCAPSGSHVAAALEAVAESMQHTSVNDRSTSPTGDSDDSSTSNGTAATSSASHDAGAPAALLGLSPSPAVSATPYITSTAPPGAPQVLSLEPESLLDVADSCVAIAQACGEPPLGRALRDEFIGQLQAISRAISHPNGVETAVPPRRVFVLEWLDPPFDAGHWVPEIHDVAMGEFGRTSCAMAAESDRRAPPVPAAPVNACTWSAKKSKRIGWDRIADFDPEILIVSCCGFSCARNITDARITLARNPVARALRAVKAGCVFAVDGNRYLARPGPSLAQGAAAVAAAIWHDDPVRTCALAATGLVPEKGAMWDKVDVNPDVDSTLGMVGMVSGVGDVEDVPAGGAGAAEVPGGWAQVHAEATANGDKFYEDPESRLSVMTSAVHKERGSCCGRACRHCPYEHERVAMHVRPEMISRAAWLQKPTDASGGRDGAVTARLCGGSVEDVERAAEQRASGANVVLVAPLDAESRMVKGTELHAVDVRESARVAGVPLVGVPVHRGGPGLAELLADAKEVLKGAYGGADCTWMVSESLAGEARAWADGAGLSA
eukprot:jgi/Ulvmu1/3911/UM018_0134.1